MAHKVFITRQIPDAAQKMLFEQGFDVTISDKDRILSKEELITELKKTPYNAVLCLLTDRIDAEVFEAAGKQCKIFANYAVGIDNIDLKAARERDIMVTNTPDVLTDTVAEHTFALILSIAHRVAEGDRFMRAGKFTGWAPMLLFGQDISGKTLGIIGSGRIGTRVAHYAHHGFGMNIVYHDTHRNETLEKEYKATFVEKVDDLLPLADIVSIHVPLVPATQHLINDKRIDLMKNTSYLINTSRGPIVDEEALIRALRTNRIAGAALDVFEREPEINQELKNLENLVFTPHMASATEKTRQKMASMAASNIIDVLSGRVPQNVVDLQ